MILIEKLQKYQPYHQVKLISMNILLVKKFTDSPLGKAFEKQTKAIQDQGEKQTDALKSLECSDKQSPSIKDFISKERINPEIVDEIEKIEEEERKAYRSKRVYKGYNKTYDFRKFKLIHVFSNETRNDIINMSMVNDEKKKSFVKTY